MYSNGPKDLKEFEKIVGYEFNDPALLERALTTPQVDLHFNYERLEFGGDAVLNLVITDLLLTTYRDASEADLTYARNDLRGTGRLVKLARYLNIQDWIIGGVSKTKELADVLEAIIGAIYIDGGFEVAHEWTTALFVEELAPTVSRSATVDYKTKFQEFAQAKYRKTPVYEVLGRDEQNNFVAVVLVGGKEYGRGSGSSKIVAQQKAAKAALQLLG